MHAHILAGEKLMMSTTIDYQTHVRATGSDPACGLLQLQMGEGSQRICAACIKLPYGPPPTLTERQVRAAFKRSQDTLDVVKLFDTQVMTDRCCLTGGCHY